MAFGGAVLGVSDNYALALLGRIVSGAGAVLLNLIIAKMVADWFVGREISFAMGSVAVSWGVGISIGLLTQNQIASSVGWNRLMYLVALTCVLAVVLVLVFYRPPSSRLGEHQTPSSCAIPCFRIAAACLVAGAIWGIFNAGVVNFFSFTPEYLAAHGLTLIEGAFFTTLTLWISILFVPLSGYFVYLARKPDLAICIFSVLIGLVLLLLAAIPSTAMVMCIIAGIVMAPPIGAILALPARVAAAEQRGGALGLFYSCYYMLATIGPPIAGALRDITGNAASPVMFAAVLFMVVPVLMVPFWTLTRYSTLRS
jgi:predicted MFS family arabinose efflux permease